MAIGSERLSILWTVLQNELRRSARHKALWAAWALVFAAFVAALGVSYVQFRSQRPGVKKTEQQAITIVNIPNNPFSLVCSRLNPILFGTYNVGFPVYSVRSAGVDITSDPVLEEYDAPDPTFVIGSLFTLMGLFAGVGSFAEDRNRHVLEELLATTPSRGALLLGKVLGALIIPSGFVLLCGLVASCLLTKGCAVPLPLISHFLGQYLLLAIACVAVYVLLGTWISLGSSTLSEGMYKGVLLWVSLVIVIPPLCADAAEGLRSTPSTSSIELAIASMRTRNQNLANFEAAGLAPDDHESFVRLYRRYEGSTVAFIVDEESRYQERLRGQARLGRSVESLLPSAAYRLGMMRLTATSFDDLFATRANILAFKQGVATYVFQMRAPHHDSVVPPHFDTSPPNLHGVPTLELAVLVAELGLLFLLSLRRIHRVVS